MGPQLGSSGQVERVVCRALCSGRITEAIDAGFRSSFLGVPTKDRHVNYIEMCNFL